MPKKESFSISAFHSSLPQRRPSLKEESLRMAFKIGTSMYNATVPYQMPLFHPKFARMHVCVCMCVCVCVCVCVCGGGGVVIKLLSTL